MKNTKIVTEEEMAALFPNDEVSKTHFDQIRPKMKIRFVIICLLLATRALVVTYYPEYLLGITLNGHLLNANDVKSLIQFRMVIALFIVTIYIYSLYKNVYFRSINIFLLSVFSYLIFNDITTQLLSTWDELSYLALAMIASRVIVLVLILQNYLDVR